MAVLVALVATAACSPANTQTPSPSPTPAPIDAASAFGEIVADPNFSGHIEGVKEVTIAGETAHFEEDFDFSGADAHGTTIIVAGGERRVETIKIGPEYVAMRDDGPWVIQTGEITAMLHEVLRGLPDLSDMGVETVDGRDLHHLVPADPDSLDLIALLGVDGTVTEATGTIDLFVLADGTPAILRESLTYTQRVAGEAELGELSAEYDITLGPVPAIRRPAEVWSGFASSEFPYTAAYPETWLVDGSSPDFDRFSASAEACHRSVFVSHVPDLGGSDVEWVVGYVQDFLNAFGDLPETIVPAANIEVAGIPANLVSLHSTAISGCGELHLMEAVFAENGRGWGVLIGSPSGEETRDRELLDLFLLTFGVRAD